MEIKLQLNLENILNTTLACSYKKNEMPELKIKQLEFESGMWKRLLNFMIDENIHFKKMLSEILKYDVNKTLLEQIEDFHTRLLKQDEFIGLLRNEISEFDKLTTYEIDSNENVNTSIKKITNLRNTMMKAENHFEKLKLEFVNSFL